MSEVLRPGRSWLWLKLVASLAAVVLVSSLLTVVLVRLSLASGMRTMLARADGAQAAELAGAAERFIDQGGTIQEFSRLIGAVPRGVMFMRNWPEHRAGMMGPGRIPGAAVPPRGQPAFTHLAIADAAGVVLFHTMEGPAALTLSQLRPQRGWPVRSGGQVQAYIFVGSMLDPMLGPWQAEFLRQVGRSTVLAAALGLLVALALGSILFLNIMSPLRALAAAAAQVAAGNLAVRLPTDRSDELGALSAGFNGMTRSLAEADAGKRRLVVDAAHELRTPVGLMQTRLELMLDGVYPVSREHLAALHGNVLLMGHLIHDLQELSAVEGGRLRLELAPLAIGELLAGLVEDFRPQATDRRLELSLVLPDYGLPILRADRARLAQVFNNLLANALIACAEGGRIELRAAVAPAGDRLDVLCVDDGVGIAPEERERIFERFYRLDSSRNRRSGGSGLGLAISRELVRLHGGSLTAEANPAGRGSLLRVSLPLSAPGGSA